jgi:hypothetical protein
VEREGKCELSAVMVVNTCRSRAQRALDAVAAQTVADAIETIVVDVAPEGTSALRAPSKGEVHYLRMPGSHYGRARVEGARSATTPVVAFLEDHCFPRPDWAAALIDAHRGPWAAVGYAFTNANPESYVSRAALLADYGMWVAPVDRGPARWLAGNNVSYKRELLLALVGELDGKLEVDFPVQEALHRRGHALFLEPAALVAHENFVSVRPVARANYEYARLFAAHRAAMEHWSIGRRLVYCIGSFLLSPALRVVRGVRALRGRPGLLQQLVASLPVMLAIYQVSAVGEALGYLRGPGGAAERFAFWELQAERAPSG